MQPRVETEQPIHDHEAAHGLTSDINSLTQKITSYELDATARRVRVNTEYN